MRQGDKAARRARSCCSAGRKTRFRAAGRPAWANGSTRPASPATASASPTTARSSRLPTSTPISAFAAHARARLAASSDPVVLTAAAEYVLNAPRYDREQLSGGRPAGQGLPRTRRAPRSGVGAHLGRCWPTWLRASEAAPHGNADRRRGPGRAVRRPGRPAPGRARFEAMAASRGPRAAGRHAGPRGSTTATWRVTSRRRRSNARRFARGRARPRAALRGRARCSARSSSPWRT